MREAGYPHNEGPQVALAFRGLAPLPSQRSCLLHATGQVATSRF
jgi:hypothetical protein